MRSGRVAQSEHELDAGHRIERRVRIRQVVQHYAVEIVEHQPAVALRLAVPEAAQPVHAPSDDSGRGAAEFALQVRPAGGFQEEGVPRERAHPARPDRVAHVPVERPDEVFGAAARRARGAAERRPLLPVQRDEPGHDRAPSLPATGTALGMWPAALRALDALGLGGPARATGRPQPAGALLRIDGSRIARVETGRDPVYLLSRPALLRLLAGGLPDGVVRYGTAV